MKILRFAAVGVAAALALTACSSGDDTPSETAKPTTDASASESAAAPEAATIKLWLVGPDTPKEARDYLTTTFETQNPGSKLVIEEQGWGDLVTKLTTRCPTRPTPRT